MLNIAGCYRYRARGGGCPVCTGVCTARRRCGGGRNSVSGVGLERLPSTWGKEPHHRQTMSRCSRGALAGPQGAADTGLGPRARPAGQAGCGLWAVALGHTGAGRALPAEDLPADGRRARTVAAGTPRRSDLGLRSSHHAWVAGSTSDSF